MVQWKTILKRLRKPSVIISLVGEVVAIIAMFNIKLDKQYITQIVFGITTVLTTIGVLDNPDTVKKGFGDDVMYCDHCGKETTFTKVNGEEVCSECGTKK